MPRTRPIVVFANIRSVECIYAIFQRFADGNQ